jgi:hypothetical protein
MAYLKNVSNSMGFFFHPATTYLYISLQANKIKYYDLVYSFNLSYFAHSEDQQRRASLISAIPKFLLYLIVILGSCVVWFKQRQFGLFNLIITCTILYVFVVSSLMELSENMHLRYEMEPLFLILAAQFLASV